MKAPLEFRIHGMDCADEVAILRREIVPLVGSPDRLGFDILRGKMLIAPGSPVITADQIVRIVGRTGMRAEPWQDVRPGAAEAGFWQRRGRTVMTALSGTFLLSVSSLMSRTQVCVPRSDPKASVSPRRYRRQL
jgi:Cd2+/Zn2+-exporting ATPase